MSEKLNSKKTETSAKINPFTLTRPMSKSVEKEYTDPTQPDVVIKLKLKSLDVAEIIACSEIVDVYVARYMGDGETVPTTLFPLVGGQKVALSKLLLQQAVMLASMQDRTENYYTVEDFVALSVTMPNAWVELSKSMTELQKGSVKNS